MMRLIASILAAFAFVIPTMAQSKYGLSCQGDACVGIDRKATERMANSKTICSSGDSGFTYSKKDVPSQLTQQIYWRDINAAERITEREYRAVDDCAKADLIVKITLDTLMNNVSLTVTDGDSGETVFTEDRSVQDKRSDLIRAAQHFGDAVKAARTALQDQQERAVEAQREKERQAELAEKSNQCQIEFESLKQMVILNMDRALSEQVLNKITGHNSKCPNTFSAEKIKAAKKADDDAKLIQEEAAKKAKLIQEEAAKEKVLKEKRAADIEKEKIEALVAFKQQLVSTPFAPPTEGWMRAVPLTSSYYIILPGRKWETNDCHFAMDGSLPVLDCLGAGAGRNNYFSVQNNNRWYLLKSKRTETGEYAGTVKDGGTTICLRQAGCYHVLAEVRQVPSRLPNKFQVSTPDAATLTYSNDDFSFKYPQNWKTEEKKSEDNTVVTVQVASPEAHLASWVTHGFFVGHITKFASSPQTLEGAYDLFMKSQRQRGLVIGTDKALQVGNTPAKIATYTSSSVLEAGESGWIVVAKDKGEGYYWVMMFYPSNDDTGLYKQSFAQILESFKFNK
jgi:hypothetical protein